MTTERIPAFACLPQAGRNDGKGIPAFSGMRAGRQIYFDNALPSGLPPGDRAPAMRAVPALPVQALALAALSISDFISLTASGRPDRTARAMMLWPMLSSQILGIAATGMTF